MALDKEHKYVNQVAQEEHDDTANVELKKVGSFGWNSDSLEWKRLSTDANGKLNVNATATIDTTGLATSTKQSDGSQKTQIVDAGGEAVTVTGGKLDVNASVDTTGLATSAKQDDIITAIGAIPGGGGVQYIEGDTDATITGTAALVEGAADALNVMTQPLTDTQLRATAVPISGTVALDLTGTDFASQTTLASIDSNVNSVDTRLNSIDSKTPALGQALAADSVPVVLTAAQVSTLTPPAAITGFATSAKQDTIIGHVDGLEALATTIDADTSNISTKIDTIAGAVSATHMQVDVLTAPTTAVTGTFWQATQPVSGTVTANATLSAETTKVIGTVNIAASQSIGLSTGSNAIGKLAANSGVDIGDVDITSIAAGTNKIGDVDIAPRTTGGWSVGNFTSGDTFTALTNSAQVIKASAGKFGGYYIYNPNTSATYVIVYDIAAASVTVGTSTPKLVFCIPASSGANLELLAGIPFSTAMSIAATTTGGGNTAPTTALEAMIFYV